MRTAAPSFPWPLLKRVSRSFYLTLRLLPKAVRPQISLAYLMARATDTVADTELVPVEDRLRTLKEMQARLAGQAGDVPSLGRLAGGQENPAERELLEQFADLLGWLDRFPAEDRRLIGEVLATITSGQLLDLQRFCQASPRRVVALATGADLDDYTYRVAGCAGEFWTRLCCRRLWPGAAPAEADLLHRARRFGCGLQMVNILRDLPRDVQQGRCYLPFDDLTALGLRPEQLIEPSHESRLRPLYQRLLEQAASHLESGWDYTNLLPYAQIRVRLACALPILLGIKTLAKLKKNPILDPKFKVKVSRSEVRWIATQLILCYPWPKKWQRLPSHPFMGSG